MRLRELQNLIQTADLGALTLKTENRQPNAITIENLNSLKATIEHLAIAPAFRELCLPILQSSLFGTPLDSYRVGVNEFDGLINPSVNKLKYAAQGVDRVHDKKVMRP